MRCNEKLTISMNWAPIVEDLRHYLMSLHNGTDCDVVFGFVGMHHLQHFGTEASGGLTAFFPLCFTGSLCRKCQGDQRFG